MRYDLQHMKAITLVIRLESLDALCRREERVPLFEERLMYRSCVHELRRRGQFKVLPYYEERLSNYYFPRDGVEKEGAD